MSINHFTIVGNITKDVELRHTPNGTATVTYIVAINNVYFDRDGNKHEEADFIPVTTYGKQAENDAKYLKKGTSVAVVGRIRSWYKKEDNKGGFNFEAERVQYLGKPTGQGVKEAASNGSVNSIDDPFVRDMEAAERAQQIEYDRRFGVKKD
jgi:single-strand DNA-binding protein